ncbi:MAG: hypothetical protein C0490_05020, partial [Marivirga sp.]|nr:hypothetical protein [Marivirga sp.]
MKNKLAILEEKLGQHSRKSQLYEEVLRSLPDNLKRLHSFRIFGADLLAIPANLILKGDDDEFERPFKLLGDLEEIEVFERGFRSEIPDEYIQIGDIYGATEIVILNRLKDTIHIFHVSDVADKKWLKHKLENEICNLNQLIDNLRPQTVCCLINPKDYSQWDILEIRNENELKKEDGVITYSDRETTWMEYKKSIETSLRKGYHI